MAISGICMDCGNKTKNAKSELCRPCSSKKQWRESPRAHSEIERHALMMLRQATADGNDKYPDDPYPTISIENHLMHAALHLSSVVAGVTDDNHIEHAVWRLVVVDLLKKNGGAVLGPSDAISQLGL